MVRYFDAKVNTHVILKLFNYYSGKGGKNQEPGTLTKL